MAATPTADRPLSPGWAISFAAAVTVLLCVIALLLPGYQDCPSELTRRTHLLCLMQQTQPLNPLVFLAMPAVLVLVLIITDLRILFDGSRAPGWARMASNLAGLAFGPLMLAICCYLAVRLIVPHTLEGGWLGWMDILSTLAYVCLAIPAAAITLIELDIIGKDRRDARRFHTMAVTAALIIAVLTTFLAVLNPTIDRHPAPPAPAATPGR